MISSRPLLSRLFGVICFSAVVACAGAPAPQQPSAPAAAKASSTTMTPTTSTTSTPAAREPIDVVFVCQYGYAKSLVAAKHFERLAERRGIKARVVARGITPKDAVPPPLSAALKQDGFDVSAYRPMALGEEDLAGAEYVITFGVAPAQPTHAVVEHWDDVGPLTEDYAKARDQIAAHLEPLLERVERAAK